MTGLTIEEGERLKAARKEQLNFLRQVVKLRAKRKSTLTIIYSTSGK
jgi:hypothetical protein